MEGLSVSVGLCVLGLVAGFFFGRMYERSYLIKLELFKDIKKDREEEEEEWKYNKLYFNKETGIVTFHEGYIEYKDGWYYMRAVDPITKVSIKHSGCEPKEFIPTWNTGWPHMYLKEKESYAVLEELARSKGGYVC